MNPCIPHPNRLLLDHPPHSAMQEYKIFFSNSFNSSTIIYYSRVLERCVGLFMLIYGSQLSLPGIETPRRYIMDRI